MADIADYEAVRALPLLSWGDLPGVAYSDASMRFGHRQNSIVYPYIDGEGHHHTGRTGKILPTRLYFMNTADGAGTFPGVFNDWMKALEDGSPRDMVHPLAGKVKVRVLDVSASLSARSLSGSVVDVTWTTTLVDPEAAVGVERIKVNVRELASKADRAIQNAEVLYPSGKAESSVTELANALLGLPDQVAVQLKAVQAQGVLTELIDTLREVFPTAHARSEAEEQLVGLWAAIADYSERKARKQRPTRGFVVANDTTVPSIARERGNTEQDIIELNPDLLASPVVPRDTAVLYYVA